MKFDPGSFRDPAGRVLHADGRVFRAVFDAGSVAYEQARAAGVFGKAVERGRLIGLTEREPEASPAMAGAPRYLLEHPRIDFVSYPYEWTFSALKAAALLHLDPALHDHAPGNECVACAAALAFAPMVPGWPSVEIHRLPTESKARLSGQEIGETLSTGNPEKYAESDLAGSPASSRMRRGASDPAQSPPASRPSSQDSACARTGFRWSSPAAEASGYLYACSAQILSTSISVSAKRMALACCCNSRSRASCPRAMFSISSKV